MLSRSVNNYGRSLTLALVMVCYLLLGIAYLFIIWPALLMAYGLRKFGVLVGKVGAYCGRRTP